MGLKLPPDRGNVKMGEWVSVVKGTERVDRTYSKCDVSSYVSRRDESGWINIDVPEANLNQGIEKMKHSVIGRLDFNRVNFEAAKASFLGQWGLLGSHSFVLMAKGFFIVRLCNAEDKMKIRHQGPWVVNAMMNRRVTTQKVTFQDWVPNFSPETQRTSRATVWVRFPGLGLEYWEEDTLMRMGVGMGNPIAVDKKTVDREVGYYAQVLVDVDFAKGVTDKLKVNAGGRAFFQQVVIPFPPDYCKHCKIIGHDHTNCRVYEYERNMAFANAEKDPEIRNKMMEQAKKKRWEQNKGKKQMTGEIEEGGSSGKDRDEERVTSIRDDKENRKGKNSVEETEDMVKEKDREKQEKEDMIRKEREEVERNQNQKKLNELTEDYRRKEKELEEMLAMQSVMLAMQSELRRKDEEREMEGNKEEMTGSKHQEDSNQDQTTNQPPNESEQKEGIGESKERKDNEGFKTPNHTARKLDVGGGSENPEPDEAQVVTNKKKKKSQKEASRGNGKQSNPFTVLGPHGDQSEEESLGEKETDSLSMEDWVEQSQRDIELRRKEGLRKQAGKNKEDYNTDSQFKDQKSDNSGEDGDESESIDYCKATTSKQKGTKKTKKTKSNKTKGGPKQPMVEDPQ